MSVGPAQSERARRRVNGTAPVALGGESAGPPAVPAAAALRRLRALEHPGCVVCSGGHPTGLRVHFEPDGAAGVAARVRLSPAWEGYAGIVHGGLIASLLDGAMTNCLFAHDVVALTGELRVRFLRPLPASGEALVAARVTQAYPPLYVLDATLMRDGQLIARASAKFMSRSALCVPEGQGGEHAHGPA